MADGAGRFGIALVLLCFLSRSQAGDAEVQAMQNIRAAFNTPAARVFGLALTKNYGNQKINQFLTEAYKELKGHLEVKEANLDFVEDLIIIATGHIENITTFKAAVSPPENSKGLDPVIEVLEKFKSALAAELRTLKAAKADG